MDAIDVARKLSGDGRVSALEIDPNRYFRIWDWDTTRIIKLDRSRHAHERELLVLSAVDGMMGTPLVLDTGEIDDWYWISFAEAGEWNLSVVRNGEIGRRMAFILSQIHELPFAGFPEPVITNDWIRHEYHSVIGRLRPMRRLLGIESDTLDLMSSIPAPTGSVPRPAHMGNKAASVFIGTDNVLTILGWEHAGIAPPEWDITQTICEFELSSEALGNFEAKSGWDIGPIDLNRWVAFHTARDLLARANKFDTGSALKMLLARLERSLRVARLEKQPV